MFELRPISFVQKDNGVIMPVAFLHNTADGRLSGRQVYSAYQSNLAVGPMCFLDDCTVIVASPKELSEMIEKNNVRSIDQKYAALKTISPWMEEKSLEGLQIALPLYSDLSDKSPLFVTMLNGIATTIDTSDINDEEAPEITNFKKLFVG